MREPCPSKPQKNSSFRIVQDLRRINAKTKNVKKASPKLPEFIFQKLKNKVVSSVDANIFKKFPLRSFILWFYNKMKYFFKRICYLLCINWYCTLVILQRDRILKYLLNQNDSHILSFGFLISVFIMKRDSLLKKNIITIIVFLNKS